MNSEKSFEICRRVKFAAARAMYKVLHKKMEQPPMQIPEQLILNPVYSIWHVCHGIRNRRNLVSAVIGAIIAAAHNSSLVIVDAGAVDVIARYIKQLCPAVQPYILQASKLIAHSPDDTDDELDGEAICIAVETVRAALYGISEMKSFKDTGVDYAIDGVGSIHQFN